MATGAGAGGPGRVIGGGVVTLRLDTVGYYTGLVRAQQALNNYARHANTTFTNIAFGPLVNGLTRATSRWKQLDQAVVHVANSIRDATRAAVAFNAAMGGQAATAVAAVIRAQAAAQAANTRATAAALAAQQKAQAQAAATGVRATASALAQQNRAAGAVQAGIIRAQQLTAVTAIKTAGGLAKATINGLLAPIRGLLGGGGGGGLSLGRLGVLAGGVGTAFSLKYIVEKTIEMESQTVKLQRAVGGTRAETDRLVRSFSSMASVLAGPELDEIIKLGNMAARLGVPAEQVDIFTRDLAKMSAVLEDIPLDEAATRISGLLGVFGKGATDAIRFASALNKLDLSSNATAGDILNITNRMSGVAASLGMTPQKTLALATALRQARVPLETAGTAMSQILSRMASVKTGPVFARIAGMDTKAFRATLLKDPLEAFKAVEAALAGMDTVHRFQALETLKLSGQRTQQVMLQMIPLMGTLNKFVEDANSEWGSLASIMGGFNQQAETAASMLRRMWNNVQLTAIALGKALLPVVKGVADGISALAIDIRTVVTEVGPQLESWGKRVGEIFESLGAIGRVGGGGFGGALSDFWGQFYENGKIAFLNIVILGADSLGKLFEIGLDRAGFFFKQMSAMFLSMFQGMAQQVQGALGERLFKSLPFHDQIAAIAKMTPGAAANMKPTPIKDLLKGWDPFADLQGLPGFHAPAGLGEAMKGQRVEREMAAFQGNLADWIARKRADLHAGNMNIPVLGKLLGLSGKGGPGIGAFAPDAGAGAGGGFGGGLAGGAGEAGGGNVPMGGMPAMPKAPGGLEDMVLGSVAAYAKAFAKNRKKSMNMIGGGWAAPWMGPIADSMAGDMTREDMAARGRHVALDQWRERVAGRGQRPHRRTLMDAMGERNMAYRQQQAERIRQWRLGPRGRQEEMERRGRESDSLAQAREAKKKQEEDNKKAVAAKLIGFMEFIIRSWPPTRFS